MPQSTKFRTLSALLLLSLFAVACSRTPPGSEVAIGGNADVAFDETADEGFGALDGGVAGGDAATTGTGGAVGAGTDAGGGFTDPATGAATAGQSSAGGTAAGTAVGAGGSAGGGGTSGGQGSTGGSATAPVGSGPGIKGRTIKIAFHLHQNDCPEQATEPNDNVREKGRRVIAEYVKFYNQYVLKEHNWKFAYTLVDDGGYFCPERQRAAGLRIAKEIKPFAAIGDSASAQGPIVADVVTRAGIIHAGGNWSFQAEEKARHPYAWNLYATSEQGLIALVDWMDKRVKGTKVPNRSIAANPMVDRVYGILGLDEQQGRKLAKLTHDRMVAAGMKVKGVYFSAPSAGVAAQQAPTTVAKMREDGVNTLVWGLEFGGGKDFYVAFTQAMEQQNYLPDVMLNTTGGGFWDQLNAKRVWANAKGVSALGVLPLRVAVTADGPVEEYDEINENASAFTAAWEKMGHTDNPQEGAMPGGWGVFSNLGLLATGIIHAGDVLNAQTFARGLESAGSPGSPNRCTVARFMGRDYPHVPSFTWTSEHAGGARGWTPVYWVNKQTPFNTNGYYESYDNYVYYRSKKDLPAKPTHDTGEKGTNIKKQKRIGLRPWKSCSQFPNFKG